uniref:Uncharacterized protein n=1 Tax=Tetranychus urticae TaxID=32264 RepID=T1KNF4_TETUR
MGVTKHKDLSHMPHILLIPDFVNMEISKFQSAITSIQNKITSEYHNVIDLNNTLAESDAEHWPKLNRDEIRILIILNTILSAENEEYMHLLTNLVEHVSTKAITQIPEDLTKVKEPRDDIRIVINAKINTWLPCAIA